jgi:hypothetical protein
MANETDYQIEIEGKLGKRWTGWFAGMTVAVEEVAGEIPITTLSGPLADQAALLGILYKLHNLGLDIVQVKREGRWPSRYPARIVEDDSEVE